MDLEKLETGIKAPKEITFRFRIEGLVTVASEGRFGAMASEATRLGSIHATEDEIGSKGMAQAVGMSRIDPCEQSQFLKLFIETRIAKAIAPVAGGQRNKQRRRRYRLKPRLKPPL
jgi:hypothetical protein